jgi:hypothetical protein
MLYFDPVTYYLNRGDKGINIEYIINYMKVFE